jgi:hypothetical protein
MSALHSKATTIHRLHSWEFDTITDRNALLVKVEDVSKSIEFKRYVTEDLEGGIIKERVSYKATLTLSNTVLADNVSVVISVSDYETYNGNRILDKVNNTTYILTAITPPDLVPTAITQLTSAPNKITTFTLKYVIPLTIADIGKRCYQKDTKTFYDLVSFTNNVAKWSSNNTFTQEIVEDWDTVLEAGVYYCPANLLNPLATHNPTTTYDYVGFVQKLSTNGVNKVIQTVQTIVTETNISSIREYKRFSYYDLLLQTVVFSSWQQLNETIEHTFSNTNEVTITHNLGKYPLVNILKKETVNNVTTYEIILANTVHISVNQVKINFSTELTGKILLN